MNPQQALAAALDPVQLAVLAGYTMDTYQMDSVRQASDDGARSLWAWSRQAGKTFCAALIVYHTMLFRPGSLTVHVGPKLDQGKLLHKAVMDLHNRTGRPIAIEASNSETITLENKSRLVLVPARPDTSRGHSAVSLLVLDEAAWLDAEVINALTPSLATTTPPARLLAMSTFNGRSNWFFDKWEHGGPDWTRSLVSAERCPRLTPSFLDSERRSMPNDTFMQEYFCVPMTPAGAVFSFDLVQTLLGIDPDIAEDGDSTAATTETQIGPLPHTEIIRRSILIDYKPQAAFIRSEL